MNTMFKLHGFTFIELLLVVSLVFTLSLFATPFYARFYGQNAVLTAQDELVSALRKAQIYSMMGKQNGVWGVSYSSSLNTFTLFVQGNGTFNETLSVQSSVNVSGLTQVTFAHATGLPSSTPTITLSEGSTSKIVTLNSQGIVNRN